MSAESQNVVLEFKIQDSSLAKLEDIMSGAGSGGKGKQSTSGIAGLQSSMNKSGLMSVVKLSGIAIGVLGLVGLVKKITGLMIDSSPMLRSMLKLFQVGLMFVLRPIGDFIGFLLRPLMIYLLRSVFLPWYRQMAPLMRTWGSGLGQELLAFVQDPFGTLADTLEKTNWGTLIAAIGGWFAGFGLIGYLDNILKAVGIESIMELPSLILGEKFTNYVHAAGFQFAEDIRKSGRETAASIRGFGLEVGTVIFTAGQDAGNAIRNFGLSIGMPIFEAGKALGDSIRGMGVSLGFWWTGAMSDLRVVGDNIKEGIASVFEGITAAWNSVISTLGDIKDGIVVVFDTINEAWNSIIPTIEGTITTISSALSGFGLWMMTNLGGIGNFVGVHVENFVNFFKDKLGGIWEFIGAYYNTFITFWTAIGSGTLTLSDIWNGFIKFFEDIYAWISNFSIDNILGGIGDSIGSGIDNLFNSNTNNSVNLSVSGNSGGFDLDSLREMVFGWLEDSNTKR